MKKAVNVLEKLFLPNFEVGLSISGKRLETTTIKPKRKGLWTKENKTSAAKIPADKCVQNCIE